MEVQEQEEEEFNLEASEASSERSLLQHPNREDSEEETGKKPKKAKGCSKYLLRLDEGILKPLFIHKYRASKAKQDAQFYEAYMEEGDLAEKAFTESKKRQEEEHKKLSDMVADEAQQ